MTNLLSRLGRFLPALGRSYFQTLRSFQPTSPIRMHVSYASSFTRLPRTSLSLAPGPGFEKGLLGSQGQSFLNGQQVRTIANKKRAFQGSAIKRRRKHGHTKRTSSVSQLQILWRRVLKGRYYLFR